jgi:hypothetical protein
MNPLPLLTDLNRQRGVEDCARGRYLKADQGRG